MDANINFSMLDSSLLNGKSFGALQEQAPVSD